MNNDSKSQEQQTPESSLAVTNPTFQPTLQSSPDPIVYSYTSLSDQARCSARIYFKKLAREKKIETDVNLPAIFGSAVHHAIEYRLKEEKNPFTEAQNYLEEEMGKYQYNLQGSKEYQDKYANLTACIENFETNFYGPLRERLTDPQSQVELRLETPFRKGILVGKVDVALDDIWCDWKTSAKVPAFAEIAMNPQGGFYWFLAQQTGLIPPTEFVYVYLKGINLSKTVSKNGKIIADRDNKLMRYSFPVYPTKEGIDKLLRNFVHPLAKAYEENIYFKNPSIYNCSTCPYRTACADTDLPLITD